MVVFVLFIDQSLFFPFPSCIRLSFTLSKAWLTEIHEYAQKDVVIMLLGNKVSEASCFAVTRSRLGG